MGYTTKFEGCLKFTVELNAPQLAAIKALFGQDGRDFGREDFSYIDLELNEDFTGLIWDTGTEKNYGMVAALNYIIDNMGENFPDLGFGLAGEMSAQGEDPEDRWKIVIAKNGYAGKIATPFEGEIIDCPHCGERILLEDNDSP